MSLSSQTIIEANVVRCPQQPHRGTRWDILGEMERSPRNFRKAFSWEIHWDGAGYIRNPSGCHRCLEQSWDPNGTRIWLVVSTPLKNISQLGWLFPIYGKIENVPNHQPGIVCRSWANDQPIKSGEPLNSPLHDLLVKREVCPKRISKFGDPRKMVPWMSSSLKFPVDTSNRILFVMMLPSSILHFGNINPQNLTPKPQCSSICLYWFLTRLFFFRG